MKISPIKQHSFKGILIEKPKNKEQKLEYKPFSWELSNISTSGQIPCYHSKAYSLYKPSYVDLYKDSLPDCEEIKTDKEYEFCTDIFNRKIKREYYGCSSHIPSVYNSDALNREDSLVALNLKLEAFKERKSELLRELMADVEKDERIAQTIRYQNSIKIINIFSKDDMDKATLAASKTADDFKNFAKLTESYLKVDEKIKSNKEEIIYINEARNNGTLIDISKRDVNDPNKPIWLYMEENLPHWDNLADNKFYDYFKTILESCKKVVCLPHKTIPFKDVLLMVNNKEKVFNRGEFMKKVINYVDYTISHRL